MANLKDVAELAGVSPITVSRVFNYPHLVSPSTIEIVKEAAEKLSYTPNLLARGLVTNKTLTVGVFICRLENLLYSAALSGITEQASALGYNVIIAYGSTVEESINAIQVLMNKQVDALIIVSVDFRDEETTTSPVVTSIDQIMTFYNKLDKIAERFSKRGIPIISMNQYNGKDFPNCASIVAHEYEEGTKMAISHLVENGHKKIGYLAHLITDQGLWGVRYKAFFDSVEKFNVETRKEWVCFSEDTVKGGFESMEQLLSRSERPTAIYCANDEIAVGAINACHKHMVKIPDDISIIGHDGSPLGKISYPKLTTVSIHYREMGAESMRMAVELIGNPQFSRTTRYIRPLLIERESVKKMNL